MIRITDLDEARDALLAFTRASEPGHSSLPVMRQAMSYLDNPHSRLRVIHIAGTSGKTSTSYFVRALLEAQGFRTGMTISPHILAVNERVQVAGMPIPGKSFCSYTERILDRLTPLRGILTYFELVTCLALWVFVCEDVDYAVVEVGMGGTHDATNILRRSDKVSIIGSISLDHTDRLGTTIAEIAAQKAGILIPGGAAFLAQQTPEVMKVVEDQADRIGARITVVDPAGCGVFQPSYQQMNWAMALAGVTYLGNRDGFDLPDEKHMAECKRVTPQARYEWLQVANHRILLDGAHNPEKMASLVSVIKAQGLGPFPTLATLVAAPHAKIVETISAISPVVSHLIVPEFVTGDDSQAKISVPADEIAEVASQEGIRVQVVRDLRSAVQTLLADPAPDLLITGSLYLAALVRPILLSL